MFRFTTLLLAAGLSAVYLASTAPAQTSAPKKETAADKMMRKPQAQKMRECETKAKEAQVKMQDRTSFINDCMAK